MDTISLTFLSDKEINLSSYHQTLLSTSLPTVFTKQTSLLYHGSHLHFAMISSMLIFSRSSQAAGAVLSCNISDSLSIALNIIRILKEHPFHTSHFFQAPAHHLFLSRQSSQRQRQCLLLPACLLRCSPYSKHATETSLQLPNDLHATNLEVFVANHSIASKAQNCPLPFGWLLANPVFPSWFLSCEHTFD